MSAKDIAGAFDEYFFGIGLECVAVDERTAVIRYKDRVIKKFKYQDVPVWVDHSDRIKAVKEFFSEIVVVAELLMEINNLKLEMESKLKDASDGAAIVEGFRALRRVLK